MFNIIREIFDVGYTYENDKHWLYSKTFWANFIAICFFVISNKTGYHFSNQDTATTLAFVNMILRAFTKRGIKWK